MIMISMVIIVMKTELLYYQMEQLILIKVVQGQGSMLAYILMIQNNGALGKRLMLMLVVNLSHLVRMKCIRS